MSNRSLEFRVGALIAFSVAVLTAFVLLLGGFSLGKGYPLFVDFNFSGNIQPGAPVKVSGIKVGKVDQVHFLGGRVDEKTGRRVQVRLELWLEERVRDTIRQDAQFFVNTAGVLGEQYLEIVPGSHDKPAIPAGSIHVGIDPPRTDLIVARLYEFLDSVTDLLTKDKGLIRDLIANSASAVRELNILLGENRQAIGKLIVAAERLADEGSRAIADLHEGVGDPTIVGRTLTDLDRALASADRVLTDLGPKASQVADEGTRVLGLVTAERVERALGAADSASAFMDKGGTLVDAAIGLLADLRAGKGTAGQLLAREELYADLKELVRDLKRNPWKFLWRQ
ncbi:MAG: MCE family protein [Deltaproteobacteria bacterium]|nr:MCE family protein [Deltaproteobacteria bacterium]